MSEDTLQLGIWMKNSLEENPDIAQIAVHMRVDRSGVSTPFAIIYGMYLGAQFPTESVTGQGPTFPDAIRKAIQNWKEREVDRTAELIRAIALKIIELTDTLGTVTDAALRQTFEPRVLELFLDSAIQVADKMASNGPFTVVRLDGGNALEGEAS